MTYSIEWLEKEAICIVTITNPVDTSADPRGIVKDIADIQKNFKDEIYVILDCTDLEVKFTDVVFMLANTFIGKMPEGLNRDKLHRTLVSTHKLARMWVEGTKQKQYGGYNYGVVATREEALANIRSTIQRTMGSVG